MMVLVLSILAALFSISGNVLVVFKKRIAFIIWSIGNIFWCAESIIGDFNIPLVLMNICYFALNIIAFYEWRKNKDAHKALDKKIKNERVCK